MRSRLPLVILLVPMALPASPLDGEWRVSYRGSGGGEREARLTLQGGQGSWFIVAKSTKDRRDPCIAQDWPARVQAADDGAQRLQADGKKLADFCDALDLLLRRQPDGSWQGELNGAPLRLEARR